MKEVSFKVEGLHCGEEIALLQKVVGKHRGVSSMQCHLLNGKATITYDPSAIDTAELIKLIGSTGMKATLWKETLAPKRPTLHLITTLLSGLLLIVGFVSHYIAHGNFLDIFRAVSAEHTLPLSTKLCYFASIILGVWHVLPKAYISIKHIRPDINLLMVIALVGAIFIQEWFEAASVAFLFSLALLLEQWSVGRANRAITSLLQLTPTTARLFDPTIGETTEVEADQIAVGDQILIQPGEKIPLDARVLEGTSSVDQSAITGESIPQLKEPDSHVYAGTLNEEGALLCEVTKPADQSTLAHIIELVEKARAQRTHSEQWVEKFAKIYTPIMLVLALLVMIIPPLLFSLVWFDWIYRGLVLLVIACPCALVISTPVSVVSALTSASRMGVLIKGGSYLELMGHLKAIAFDKTGTLTYGKPEVQKIVPLNNHTPTELLERAVALEKPSSHPLAQAILKLGAQEKIVAQPAKQYSIVKGKGAEALYKEKRFWIGSHRFMHEKGQETPRIHKQALALEDAGHSVIAIGTDDHVCGLISVADSPRKWAKESLASLKANGIEHLVMLTGDNEPTAKALAQLLDIDYLAELLPEEKVEAIEKLKTKWTHVGMVGDGVNDAPALATASLGIAMGAIGSDAAIEVADIALMSDDLSKIPWLMRHSRRMLKIIKQNITFALLVKGVFITLTLFNLATLWMAIAADTGATLLVIFNALRLLKAYK